MKSSTRQARILLALFLVGFVFRLLFFFHFGAISTPDTAGYLGAADRIVAGQFYSDVNETFRLPGYPLFVASMFWLSNRNLEVLLLAQIVLSAAIALLIYSVASQVFNEHSALLSGWLVALNPVFAYYSVILLPEILMAWLVALTTWGYIRALHSGRLRWFGVSGVALALLVWTKAIFLLLVPAFALAAILVRPEKVVRGFALLLVPVLTVYLGWTAHNAIKYGSSDYSPSLGLNLLERTIYLDAPNNTSPIKRRALEEFRHLKETDALGPQADALYYSLAVIDTWRYYRVDVPIPELDQQFLDVAIQQIKGDPVNYAITTAVEFAYTWAGYTPHWAKWRPMQLEEIPDWSFLVLGPCLGAIMFLLTVYGSVRAGLLKNWPALVLVLAVFLVTLATSLVIPSDYRYRLGVEPLVLSIVGYAIVSVANPSTRNLWPLPHPGHAQEELSGVGNQRGTDPPLLDTPCSDDTIPPSLK
jgi:hypothetical protein